MIGRLQPADIRLLRVFAEVARSRGFSAAASVLNIAQSTISTQIKELEERLGFSLCIRGRTGFELTHAGQRIYDAMQILEGQMSDFVASNAAITQELHGVLRVGIASVLSRDLDIGDIPGVLAAFSRKHPHVVIDLDFIRQGDVEEEVKRGAIDIAWSSTRVTGNELEAIATFTMPAHIYCGESHPLFAVPDDQIDDTIIARQHAVVHQFDTDLQKPFEVAGSLLTASSDVSIVHIAMGSCIGYLSDPVARPWVERGKLRALRPNAYGYESPGGLICRRSELSNRLVRAILALVESDGAAHSARSVGIATP